MNELLPDIPRIYTALAEWLACMVFISVLRRKIFGWKFIAFAGGALVIQSVFLVLTKNLPIAFWIPAMIVAIGMMFLFIYLICDISIVDAGYFTIKAFVAAEFEIGRASCRERGWVAVVAGGVEEEIETCM